MKVSLSSKTVVRSPSGKVITKTDLANKMAKNSRLKLHAFIPGGKLEIINTRYINQFISAGFWLKRAVKRDELQAIKNVLKEVERAKNNEFFTVIAQQRIQEELGLRLPYQVFDRQWLERKDKSRIGGFVLVLYWLVIPIKNLLRKLRYETPLSQVAAWQWVERSQYDPVNLLLNDFMLLTQSIKLGTLFDGSVQQARLQHVGGERVTISTSDLKEYEYKRGLGMSGLVLATTQADTTDKPLTKVLELVLGFRGNKVVWMGITDGVVRQTINLSSLYALTDELAIDLVAQAHQKFILDALYALPFTPTVNIQLLIEVLTLQLVAQDYAVRLLK